MAKTFSGQVGAWVAKSNRRMTGVFRESTQRVLDDANTSVGEGGRLRIDTGFLRDSLAASLDGLPSGPSRRGEQHGNPEAVNLVIAGAHIGDTLWAGWTANYAAPREAKDGFVEGAAQKWGRIVRDVSIEARRRIK